MNLRERARFLHQFFGGMSMRSRALLFAGIFFCFAPIGFLEHLTAIGSVSWTAVVVNGLFTGGLAMAYALVGLYTPELWRRSLRIAVRVALVAASGIGVFALRKSFPVSPLPAALDAGALVALRDRLNIARAASTAAAVLSYLAFIRLIQDEGRRYLRDRAEIELAREIHATLVVPIAGRDSTVEWRGSSRPSGDVGGDLVDSVRLQTPGLEPSWFGCVADVSGHGVAAGVLMGMFKTAVHSGLSHVTNLGELLTHVNQTLVPLKQSNMFVTCACVRQVAPDRLEYVLAGHPPMLHVRAGTHDMTGEWIGNQQLAVGFFAEARFESRFLDVAPGDCLVIVTDGITEVFDRHDQEFGLDGVRRAIASQPPATSLATLEAAIFSACDRHGPRRDDQTVLIARILSRRGEPAGI